MSYVQKRKAIDNVKFCPSCKWMWEYVVFSKKVVRYEPGTLPKYGKKVEVCHECVEALII